MLSRLANDSQNESPIGQERKKPMRAYDLKMISITQHFPSNKIDNISEVTRDEIAKTGVKFAKGSRIAITAGSRGIANIATIIRAVVDEIKSQEACPFIIPAMGSHGGATAEGQRKVLAHYGITEDTMGAPIVSSMDVVSIPNEENGFRLFMAKDAYDADGVVIVNRVKPHTDFHGPVESGLMKMCVIGLGKHAQALEMHRQGVYGLRELVPVAARKILSTGKIYLGIGIVENALDETLLIKAANAEDIESLDAELIDLARQNMPSLPIDHLDLLIVDELGKDKSGTGLDTNIIGRMGILGQKDSDKPTISYIIACNLTEASDGNALGMGLADFITQKFHDRIDFAATYENVMTSSFIKRGRMPMVARNEEQAVEWALRAIGPKQPEDILAMRIRSTLELGDLQVSPAVLRKIMDSPIVKERKMEVLGTENTMFDESGNLKPF